MKSIYNKILKIDNENKDSSFASFEHSENIDKYVMSLIQKISEETARRKYKFNPDLNTTKDRIDDLVYQKHVDEVVLCMGKHLANIEHEKNQKNSSPIGKIPMGILMFSLVDMQTDENDYKFIIIKSDYDVFIAEGTGIKATGLSVKNKIFKSFCINLHKDGESFIYNDICAADTSSKMAVYWVNEFLELVELHSNKDNTLNVFRAIKKEILSHVKDKFKSDYLKIYNMTVGYMRSVGTFNMDFYENELIGNYIPYDDNLKIEHLKAKIEKLKADDTFDNVFEKVPDVIKDKIKDEIELTDELNLKIKHEINNLDKVILPHKEKGHKGMFIVSDKGYTFATGLGRKENE